MTLSRKVKYGLTSAVFLTLIALARIAPPAVAQQPVAGAGADSAAIAAAILELTQKFSDALESNNHAVLDSLVAADAWVIQPNGDRQKKADWMENLKANVKFTRHDVSRTVVHVHGEDVAVAVSEQKPVGTQSGVALANANVTGRIWMNRAGQWQIVLQTITPAGAK